MPTHTLPDTIVSKLFVLIYWKRWATTKARSNTTELRLDRRPASRNGITLWHKRRAWPVCSSWIVGHPEAGRLMAHHFLYNAGHRPYKGCLWPMSWNASGV